MAKIHLYMDLDEFLDLSEGKETTGRTKGGRYEKDTIHVEVPLSAIGSYSITGENDFEFVIMPKENW